VSDTPDTAPSPSPDSGDTPTGAKKRYRLRQRFYGALVRLLEAYAQMEAAKVKADKPALHIARMVSELLDEMCDAECMFRLDDANVSLVNALVQRAISQRRSETVGRYLRARALHYHRHPAPPVSDYTPPTESEREFIRNSIVAFRKANPGEHQSEWIHRLAVTGKGARPWWLDVWDEIEAEEAGAAGPRPEETPKRRGEKGG
jgi:hypothetical protein